MKKIDLSDIERALGVTAKETRDCEKHGEYDAWHTERGGGYWSGCPSCAEERAKQEVAEEQARKARERSIIRMEAMLGRAALPPRFAGLSFDSYAVEPGNARQAHNWAVCRDYAENFPERRQNSDGLLLMGFKGTGKTHLAAAIVNHVIREHGMSAVYTVITRMFRRLKSTFNRNSEETEAQVIHAYATPDLLVLDEVGLGYCSDTELGHLFEVINERYERCLPTILVTNLATGEELETWVGERTMDRLRDGGRALLFDWESWRKRKDIKTSEAYSKTV